MCGDAWRPEAADACPTICQIRCRVSLRPPFATNKNGDVLDIVALIAFVILSGVVRSEAEDNGVKGSLPVFRSLRAGFDSLGRP